MSFFIALGPYLVVITKKTLVGHIKGHEVWIIKGTDVLAFPRATLHLTESQVHVTSQMNVEDVCNKRVHEDMEFTVEKINATPGS